MSDAGRTEAARHIRGSSVLLAGRMLSLALNLLTQVLVVRALTKADYGAFAYALAFVSAARTVVSLGHLNAITRFLSLYEERRRYDRLFGTLVMESGTIIALGLALFAGILLFRDVLVGGLTDDPQAIAVLAILVLLAPMEALDRLFEGAFAVFTKPRAIFVRKYLLTPGLRLTVVALLFVVGPSVTFVAVGYVVTGAFGVIVYTFLLIGALRERGLLQHFRVSSLSLPFREVFGFAAPLVSAEVVAISITTVSVALLGYFEDSAAVAEYRAIFPAARLNQLVAFTFVLLFVPVATRMFARGDGLGMRTMYWQTAAWLAVLSFPIFALTGPLAEPTTLALFGERYRDSAPLLAMLSFGFYFSAALGFNAQTLQTYGRLRYIFSVNLATALLNVGLSIALIQSLGPFGVAVANAAALVFQNVLNQAGLGRGIGVPLFEWRYARLYTVILAMAGALAAIQQLLEPPLLLALPLAAAASLGVLVLNRGLLDLDETFPELRRVPLLARLVASR